MSVYSHLSLEERGLISLYHDKGLSKRAIGRQLCRPASCISREIAKNSNKEAYKADTAQRRYLTRRHSGRLLALWKNRSFPVLKEVILLLIPLRILFHVPGLYFHLFCFVFCILDTFLP